MERLEFNDYEEFACEVADTFDDICKISSKDVAERSGVTKLGNVEKAWTKPAHKEACVKTLKSFKNIFEA